MQTLPLTPNEIAAWLRLIETPGVGQATARHLLAAFGLPEEIFKQSCSALAHVVGVDLAGLIKRPPSDGLAQQVARTVEWAAAADQHFVTLCDPAYPQTLLHLADPPLLLYVKGQLALLHTPSIGIVGSRNATPQGLANAEQFAQTLSNEGFTVVSGLALGIDGAAHRGALKGHGSTIAVMGTGIDLVYPTRHHQLAQQISVAGALVSEWPLGAPARAPHFPQRNRIIAALAQAILVIEAAAQSGSLITARLAAEIGREIGAVPGSIHSPVAKGCHRLIREGAKLVESAQDLLDEMQTKQVPPPNASSRASKTSSRLSTLPSSFNDAHNLEPNGSLFPSATNQQSCASQSEQETKEEVYAAHSSASDENATNIPLATSSVTSKVDTQTNDQKPKSLVDLPQSIDALGSLDLNAQRVLDALGYDMAAFELLAARTGLASAALQAALLSLELGDWITTLPGGRVIRRQKTDID